MAKSNVLSRYALILFMFVVLTGCGGSSSGGGGGGGGGTAVEIKLKVSPSEDRRSHKAAFAPSLSAVAKVRISVADPAGRTVASASIPTAGGVAPDQVVPLQLDVPIGPARLFRAEALELSGKILFEGEASADILIGVSVTIPIEIKPAPTLNITPATAIVLAGKTIPFIPVVTELEDRSVLWSVNEIQGGNNLLGTITPATEGDQAIYTAPVTPPTPNVVTIKATAKVRPDRFATAAVTVLPASQGIFVNGEAGGDLPDCGAEASPCRTLTQGVGKATVGQVVVVAPGIYRFGSATGEPLPLVMKRGVTIQGSGADQTTLELNSLTFDGGFETNPIPSNAAIIGADQATLTRFTIQTNDCPGPVILLRDVSPVISENTFLGGFLRCSTAIRLLGNSAPVILGNRFGAVEREFNIALSVEEGASPAILQNTLRGNLTAIRTSQHATARIEENTIIQNGIGMLIEDDSNPDLGGGEKGSGGGNTLSCNTEADLRVIGTAPLIFAQSNAWDNLPPITAIDIVGKSETVNADHPKEAERPCSVPPTTTTSTTAPSTTTTAGPTTTTAPSTTTTAPRTTPTTSSSTTRPTLTTTTTTPTTTSTLRPTTTTSTTVTTIRPTTTTSSSTTQPTTTSTTTTTRPTTTSTTTTRPTTTTTSTSTTTSTTRPTTTTTSTTTTTAPSTTTTIRNTPPTPPGRLVARALDRSEIDLTWLASIDDAGVKGYRIDRCEGAGCKDFVEIGQAATPGFADTGLSPATVYTYKVRAFDGALFSGDSNLASATTLRGQGTAKIDGTLSAGEWDPAARFNVKVALPNGGSTEGTLLLMNDAENLYMAFTYAGKPFPRDLFRVEFDNNHDGRAEAGDDVLSLGPETGFHDEFRTNCPPSTDPASCIIDDLQLRGSRDGAGAFGTQDLTTYEISHPLASGDRIHDFTLKPGSTVGFFISISLMDDTGKLVQTDFPGFRDYLPLQIE